MALTPDTTIRLIKSPLELDYKNQITFATKQAQETYFKSLPYIEIENCSYQRHNNFIRWPGHIDSLLNYNYVMYQNDNYSNKWFYAFIIKMDYHNDGETYIYIQQDVFQTWQFDISWKQSFVEREMIDVNEDIPGANLLVEDLETGDYIQSNEVTVTGLNHVYVIAYSRNPVIDGYMPSSQNTVINNIASGLWYCACDVNGLFRVMRQINTDGHGDAIVTVFTVPAISLYGLPNVTNEQLNDLNGNFDEWIPIMTSSGGTVSIPALSSTLNSYSPRNQKLRTYPYLYFSFNAPNGTSKVFRYEDFSTQPNFNIKSEVNPSPSVVFLPTNYKTVTSENPNEACSFGGYPSISYYSDYFNSWIAQNQNMININMKENEFNTQVNMAKKSVDMAKDILSVPSGNIWGGASLASDTLDLVQIGASNEFYVQKQMAQIEAQKLMPNKGVIGSNNTTLLGYSLVPNNIFACYSIKKQFAERIDKYFDMFGYKTNMVKIPNTNNRPNWNYVKTIGANILGDIPQQDLEIIKNMFNSGVTLWHSTTYFLDYSQNNR